MAPTTHRAHHEHNKVLVPVRYSAWTNGDIGQNLENHLKSSLHDLDALRITRIPRAFIVEANEEAGPMVEAVHRAAVALERGVQERYPVFHHQIGPVWTGTLQAIFE